MPGDYQLVSLASGAKTLFSHAYGEKMHPGLGPQAEADLLYVRQLRIAERLQQTSGEFVIWDVGLGAAANAIATLDATKTVAGHLHLISFDNTIEPLAFARANAVELGYLAGYEKPVDTLLNDRRVEFDSGRLKVTWEFHLGDFPTLLSRSSRGNEALTKPGTRNPEPGTKLEPPDVGCYKSILPDAIFYDAFSPAKNPAMWTLPLFQDLFRVLDPARPCALTTYSRSTMLRATLLLAGFFVGAGQATGRKEETTIAANTLDLIPRPLDIRWLERATRSDSAEPLHEPAYRRSRLSPQTSEKLRRHPQFQL